MNHGSKSPHGYPLIALFLVLTACGVVASLLGPAVRAITAGQVGMQDALFALIGGTSSVGFLGACIGVTHLDRGRGLAWGVLTGAVIGMFAGPLLLAPRDSLGSVLSLSFAGAIVIVLLAVAFRAASRRTS